MTGGSLGEDRRVVGEEADVGQEGRREVELAERPGQRSR